MPTRIPLPPGICEVYLDFDWDRRAVWALDIEPGVVECEVLEQLPNDQEAYTQAKGPSSQESSHE